MIILGLDISTSITGYCLMDTERSVGHQLLRADSIIMSKEKDAYRKSIMVRETFEMLIQEYKVDKIIVEESLQAFRRGLSSAKTLSTLSRFNGVVSFLAQDIFEVPVKMINVNTARKTVGLKVDRKIDVPIKAQILEWIKLEPNFCDFAWPKKTLKSGPRKGKTIEAPQCYDIADAAVVCLAGINIEH